MVRSVCIVFTSVHELLDTSLHESKSGGGDHLIVAGEKYVVVG